MRRAGFAPVLEPLGEAEREEHQSEGNAHEGDDEREPPGVGAGAGARVATENSDQQDDGQDARPNHGAAPLKKLPRAVVGSCGVIRLGDRRD